MSIFDCLTSPMIYYSILCFIPKKTYNVFEVLDTVNRMEISVFFPSFCFYQFEVINLSSIRFAQWERYVQSRDREMKTAQIGYFRLRKCLLLPGAAFVCLVQRLCVVGFGMGFLATKPHYTLSNE